MSIGGWSDQTTPSQEVTEKFLPVSLEQRGVAIPFTSRPVAYARAFLGKNGLELILPGFTDTLLAHVIPFEKLPTITSLTVYDRALHDAITNLSVLTPQTMREASIKIGETGLAGVEIMRGARSKKVIFSNLEPAILNSLTDDLTKRHGTLANASNLNMSTVEGRMKAVLALEVFGKQHGCDGEEIVSRLESISNLMARFRGPNEGLNGPINDNISRLKHLSDDLRQWLIPEPVDEAEMAQRTSMAALDFISISKKYTEQLDIIYKDFDVIVAAWPEKHEIFLTIMDDLDRILDGWERILDAWDHVLTAQRFIQRETMASFAPFIPILPKDLIKDDSKKWLELRTAQLRWMGRIKYMVHMNEDTEMELRNTRMEVL